MSDSKPEQGKRARSAETKRYWIGISLLMLVCLSAINILVLLFIEPKFLQIYAEALSGWSLPGITEFIITRRFALAVVALGWSILGVILRRRRKIYAILWINLGII